MEKQLISQDKLLELAEPFAALMDGMEIDKGESIAEIVTAGLYAIGAALARLRVPIDAKDTVVAVLSPLWAGYRDFVEEPIIVTVTPVPCHLN